MKPPRAEWLDPKEWTPPKGEILFLLTNGGIATIGLWGEDCKGWMRKPNTPNHMKFKLAEKGDK